VRGSITSGGTESILLAVLAARAHAARARGVVGGGEIVLAPSAHAAFNMAAHYFGLTLRPVPPRAPGGALHGPDVARALSRRTVLVVASAVSFPHGVLDDVAGVAAAAAARGVPCHVDACLGGFVLPFVEDAGRPPLPAWDFRVPGVTSMSVDLHKYGQSPKGASVILFRGAALRKAAFVATTDWPGGLYVSPSLAGSRSASVVAASWAALVYNGRAGLAAAARGVLREASKFEAGLAGIPELAVVGAPASSVVAFGPSPAGRAAGLNIYVLNDALSAQGWHLNALQRPPALHMCITAQHTGGGADALLADLRAAVGKAVGGAGKDEGTAPIYGQAGTTPDRGIIRDFLETYQDVLLTG
jgi:sphinganine-1-phosphate aldolase